MTKYHTLRRLDRNLFLTVLEAMTIKSIVSAFLGSGENSSWLAGNTYLLLVSHMVERDRTNALMSLIREIIPS